MHTPSIAQLSLDDIYRRLAPVTARPSSPTASYTNWARTFGCKPQAIYEPENEYQCELALELARREGKVVRAAGVGHSPSDVACTTELMIRMTRLNRVLEVNAEKKWVVAQGGIVLHDLHAQLAQHGLAMRNVGSISDQTLAGIITTASHGSGMEFGVFSTNVLALTILLANGARVTCSASEHSDLFYASLSGLGGTGLLLEIKLEVEDAFRLKEVADSVPFDMALDDFDAIMTSTQHPRLWWFPASDTVRKSSSDRTHEPRTDSGNWFWDVLVGFHLVHLLLFIARYYRDLNLAVCRFVTWLGRPPLSRVDDSHKIFNIDCLFLQYTTEWAIPYENSQAALREMRTWLQREIASADGLRSHFPIEIRVSAADEIWMSPSYGHRTTWIGIVQYKPYGFEVPYQELFRGFEDIVIRHGGRPHWAKAHNMRPDDLRALYPRFDDFVRVLDEVDPQGMFRNEYVQRHIYGQQGDTADKYKK
ncbi:D-arabinono-1,4-lactone oxidase-domain-containing protein [Schizophyllum commune]